MSWSKGTDDTYQRPFGPSEAAQVFAITTPRPTPREPIKINAIAHFTAPYPSEKVASAFREAWKALRLLKEPDIATTFADNHKYYQVPTTGDLEIWLNQTFFVAPFGTSVQSSIEAMQQRVETLPVCEIIAHPTERDSFQGTIVLFVSHWRTEAGGCFMLINQLFDFATDMLTGGTMTKSALQDHIPGSEIQLLTPAVEEMLMPNQQSGPAAKARVTKVFDDYVARLPCLDFPVKGDLTTPPSDFKVMQRTYTPASTSALVRMCKAKSLSVTAVVHTAFIAAVRKITDPDRQDRSWTCLMPAEVRKRLPPASPYRNQGCWAAAQMLALHVPADMPFIDATTSLKQQYSLAMQETWLREDMRETTDQMLGTYGRLPPDQPTSLPWFTSLGVLDSIIIPEHGDLKIEYVTGWADSTGPGVVLRMWTFRERLSIHIAWNNAFHTEAQVQETLNLLEQTLSREVEVGLVVEIVTGLDGLQSSLQTK